MFVAPVRPILPDARTLLQNWPGRAVTLIQHLAFTVYRAYCPAPPRAATSTVPASDMEPHIHVAGATAIRVSMSQRS